PSSRATSSRSCATAPRRASSSARCRARAPTARSSARSGPTSSATRSSTAASAPTPASRSAGARTAARACTGCATTAWASTCATRTSCSAFSSACTAPTSSTAPASGSRSCSAWWRATAAASGRKPSPARARASTFPCRRRPDGAARRSRDPAGGGRSRRRGADDARAAPEQPRQQDPLGQGRSGGARLPVRRRQPRLAAQARAARPQDAQGRRPGSAAPDQGERADAGRPRGRDDLVQRGEGRGRELRPGRQQLHREAGAVRNLPRYRRQDRPVLGAHQPGAARRRPDVTSLAIRVLLVEDVATEAELEVRELRRAGLAVTHKVVDTEARFVEALHAFAPDIILSDFSMPHFDGMSALRIARERAPDIPFNFVSGTIGEEYAIRALKNGAIDYVLKTNLVRLPAAVERAIADAHERRVQRRTEIELEQARERLTSVLGTLQDMLWSMHARGERILFASPGAQQVFGYAAAGFQDDGALWMKLAHPDDRDRLEAAWTQLRGGKPIDIEYRTLWPDGTVRWVNQRARAIHSASGAVERIDGIARDVTEQAEQRSRIRHLALYDQLTDLPNRALFHERLAEELRDPALSYPGLALALIDLERFKAINDVLGAQAGDEVLKAVA